MKTRWTVVNTIAFLSSVGKESDGAEPVGLIFASMATNHPCGSFSRSPDRFVGLPRSKLAVQGRSNQSLYLSVSSRSLQGIAERPLPCNYYAIQSDDALSRRKRGFKSRRGRQTNSLEEKRLLSI